MFLFKKSCCKEETLTKRCCSRRRGQHRIVPPKRVYAWKMFTVHKHFYQYCNVYQLHAGFSYWELCYSHIPWPMLSCLRGLRWESPVLQLFCHLHSSTSTAFLMMPVPVWLPQDST